MANNHNVNARITSVNRRAAVEFQHKAHAEDGVYFVVDTTAAPIGRYYGFVVIDDAVVSSITHIDATKNGDVTTVTLFPTGFYCTQPGGFTTLTLSSGAVQLVKFIDKQ
jgi:hypothetical protein